MKTIKYLVLAALAQPAFAQPELFGIGDSEEGYYQLDTTTISGPGSSFATAWTVIVPAPNSEPRKFGASVMLVMFAIDCKGKTIQPMAWKAKNPQNQIIAEGVHGKEKRRTPASGSIDDRIYNKVCAWKKK